MFFPCLDTVSDFASAYKLGASLLPDRWSINCCRCWSMKAQASVCEQTLEHFHIGQSESQQYLCEPFLVTQCGRWLDLFSTNFSVDVPGANTMQFAPVTSLWLHWTCSAECLVGVSMLVHWWPHMLSVVVLIWESPLEPHLWTSLDWA